MKTEVHRGKSSTEVLLEGALKEVEERVLKIFQQYSPWGYGTMIKSRVERPDGTVRVVVWRANSCD